MAPGRQPPTGCRAFLPLHQSSDVSNCCFLSFVVAVLQKSPVLKPLQYSLLPFPHPCDHILKQILLTHPSSSTSTCPSQVTDSLFLFRIPVPPTLSTGPNQIPVPPHWALALAKVASTWLGLCKADIALSLPLLRMLLPLGSAGNPSSCWSCSLSPGFHSTVMTSKRTKMGLVFLVL